MPLLPIISELASQFGKDLTRASERAFLLQRINTAAKELYKSADLCGCFREQLMNIGDSNQQITLPYYVEKLLLVRHYELRVPLTIADMMPRYKFNLWSDTGWTWRTKQTSAIHTNISNSGPLTVALTNLTLPVVESFNVIITGATENSDRTTEVLIFIAGGVNTLTTTNAFTSIESIRKNVVTTYNIAVSDMDGTQLAVIPNSQLETKYTLVQVLDRFQGPLGQERLVEVLYKTIFVPFKNDYDQFPCGDIYDDAIYWKAASLIYAKMDDGKDDVLACEAKCNDILSKVSANIEKNIERQVTFEPNPFYGMFDDSFWNVGGRYSMRYAPI